MKQNSFKSVKVCNIRKWVCPNEKSNFLIYIRYFHIQTPFTCQETRVNPRKIMEERRSVWRANCVQLVKRGALGGGRGALAERGA